MGALTRKAVADVLRRPARTLLVILGIVIGVFGLTAINVSNDTVYSALAYTASETNVANVTFDTRGVSAAILPDLAAIPHVQTVQVASGYATRWQVAAAPGHVNLDILAFPDEQHIALNAFQVTTGTLPGPGEIVMEFSDSAYQAVQVGDMITVDSPNGPVSLRVSGLSRTLGAESAAISGGATGYMSMAGLDHLANLTQPNLVQAALDTSDPTAGDQAVGAIFNLLKANGVTVLGYSYDTQPFGAGPLPGIFAIMRVLSLVALLLTALLIVNTVTTLVAEQTNIIGTMKALGGTRGAIMRSYLTSVLIYGIIGTLIGLVLGIYGGYAFAHYIATLIILDLGPFSVAPTVIVTSALIGLLVPLLAALVPLWTGTRMTVRAALAGFGVSTGGRGRARGGIGILSQTTLMGLRSVFRRRGRAILTLVALTLAGTAFLAIQTTSYAVDQTWVQLNAIDNYDITLGVNTPQAITKMQTLLAGIPNVGRVEADIHDGVTIGNQGNIGISGLAPDTHVYRYHLLSGTWLTGDTPDEMVISQLVAQKLHLHVGSTLTTTLPTGSQTWQIIGIVDDPTSGTGFIGATFVTIHDLLAFNRQPQGISSGYDIQAQDRSQAAVNQLATTLDQRLSALGLAPSIETRQQQIQRSQSQFQILFAILYGVAGIIALVGILGLANTLTTSVLERRREIGILRSMGATGGAVARVFWTEGLTLALLAWLIGIALSFPAAYAFVQFISGQLLAISFVYSPLALAWMLLAILLITTLASYGPALSAARTKIADILRYE